MALDLAATCARFNVVPASDAHVDAMAPLLREGDRQEIWAAAGLGAREGLALSLAASVYAWTWLVEDVPACMFGVSCPDRSSGTGIPWLLSGGLVDRHWRPFLKYHRPFLARMRRDFDLLTNWVDASYGQAIHWLHWMGFTILPAAPYGPFGLPHHPFEMRARQ